MKNLEPEKRILGSTSQQQEIIDDLYNKHYEMLFNYAYKILQNEDTTKEVIQETFRVVSMNVDELLQSENEADWLIKALQRSIIGYLYDEHYKMLFNFACSILQNEDTAKEVIQETFRVACENIEKLMQSKNIAGWLVNTLHFTIKRFKRQKQTMSKYIARVPDDFDFENIVDERLPDEDVKILYSDLAEHKDFELLTDFAVDGKPIKEIAKKWNLSIDACTQKLSRVKKACRDKINKNNK
jgi:RNA polymerase sigma-70 factor (ECF subfamily)